MKNLLLLILAIGMCRMGHTQTIVQTIPVNCASGCTNVTINGSTNSVTPTALTATTAGNTLVWSQSSTGAPMSTLTCGVLTGFVQAGTSLNSGFGTQFALISFALNAPSITSCTLVNKSWTGAGVLYEISGVNTLDESCTQSGSVCYNVGTNAATNGFTSNITTRVANEIVIGVLGGYPATPTNSGQLTTTNYSNPATSSLFSSAIIASPSTVTHSATWASGAGYPTAGMMSFFFNPTLPATLYPIMSPNGGMYGATQTVTMMTPTNGAVVHYLLTTGATCSSPAYSGPITVSSTTTISSIACAAGWTNSGVNTQTYTITGNTTQQTWYIRNDGGTRYDVNVTTGQCDGLGDAPYSGTGVNQHCGFNDFRWLYDDQTYGNSAWVVQGGDNILVRGGPWRIGFAQGTNNTDVWCLGGQGNQSCHNPPPPSGISILGENYLSCNTGNSPNKSLLTQIFGGYGVGVDIDLSWGQNITMKCLEITSHSDCIVHGSPVLTTECSTSTPLSDFDSNGINTNTTSKNIMLQDMWIHGHTNRGIEGPMGGPITCLRCIVEVNGEADWDFDDGTGSAPGYSGALNINGTASVNATWNFLYSVMAWGGCNQNYDSTGPLPYACYAQNEGGFGGGLSDAPGGCFNVDVEHSQFLYTMQDVLNSGHADSGPGGGYADNRTCFETVTNNYFFGTLGSAIKIGPTMIPQIITGNVIIGNCARPSASIPGIPTTFNQVLINGDMCRAGGTPISDNFPVSGGAITFSNNTVVTYAPTVYLFGCQSLDYMCPTATLNFQNNVTYGLMNATINDYYNGNTGGIGGFYWNNGAGSNAVANTWNRTNNQFFGVRTETCPTGFSGDICSDVKFINEPAECLANGGAGCSFTEATWDNFNYRLSSISPARAAGVSWTGIPTSDFLGNSIGNPPDMGAVQFQAGVLQTITVTPTMATIVVAGTDQFNAACLYSDGTTTPCNVTWTDTDNFSSINSTTGVVTGISAGTDTVTATISTIFGTGTLQVNNPPPFVKLQGVIVRGKTN